MQNLSLLLCIGLCIGLAKRDKGTAALAGVTGYLVMTATIKALVGLYMGKDASIDTGVIGAIVVGQSLFGYITATTIFNYHKYLDSSVVAVLFQS